MNPSNENTIIYPIEDSPFGNTWSEWSVKWWQWILSIPSDRNPGNGHDTSLYQHDKNVFFLAGSFGGKVERRIVVPAGKSIFFPVINFTTSYAEDPSLKSEEDLISDAKKDMDDIIEKTVEIDNKKIPDLDNYRIGSKPFNLVYYENNVFNAKPGQTKGISDGFWIFLRPLSPGEHNIHTIGACSSGKTKVEVTYYLSIK